MSGKDKVIKYLIIEDERHNSRMLEAQISSIRPNWEKVDIIEKVSTGIEWFKNNELPDVVFMDIQLKDGISFSIFEKVAISCPVIFTTAYDEYAIRAFEVTSIDYLLKPIEESKLKHAVEKFEQIFATSQTQQFDISEVMRMLKSEKKEYRKRFLVEKIDSFYKLDVNKIAYIKSEAGICMAVTFENEEHHLSHTLEKLENELDPELFFRANRNYILHIESVQKFENYFGSKLAVLVKPKTEEPIIVSRLKATAFKQWFDR